MRHKSIRHNCHCCSYCKKKGSQYYCDDLDYIVDPDDPICTEENYYA